MQFQTFKFRQTAVARAGVLALALTLPVAAQTVIPDETQFVPTFVYEEKKTEGVDFIPNYRIPEASGEAKVERKRGMTEIEIELDEMKTALHFGGDYATYVLWAVSPEGESSNLGEFILNGNRSKLDVSTHLQTFGMIVTAEPHFMVTSPSRFIVLSNAPDDAGDAAALRYVGDEGVYNYTNTRLTHAPESSGDIQTGVRQANVAVQLAERAGAAQFAPGELAEARKALDAMILAVEDGALDRSGGLLARDAIRIAARAEKLAKAGVAAAAMESERQEFRNALARLNQELDATRITLEREIAMAEGRQVRLEVALEAARERTAEALDRILDTRETAQGLIVSLPDVLFDTGQSTLKVETREALARVAGILQLIPGFQIQVEGHTDDVGSAAYNQSLAGDRAVSVQNYLVGAGVPASNVRVVAFGESRPLASNLTAEGREKNRRVELVITDVASQAALLPEE